MKRTGTPLSAAMDDLMGQCAEAIGQIDTAALRRAIEAISDCADNSGHIWLIGNGGSMATASHLAADLTQWASPEGATALRATCLADNVALLTALVNDVGWDHVYSYQLVRRAAAGDVLVAISVHGGVGRDRGEAWSQNLVRSLTVARDLGCLTIGLSGFDGGVFGEACDVHLHVPAASTPVVESIHGVLAHAIADGLRRRAELEI
jgi:D-sedoheptulose 7-phosphate isomerase